MRARWFFLASVACSAASHVESIAPRASTCGAPLPAKANDRAQQLLQTAHAGAVTEMAESADGYLATTSQFDHTIRIWNLQQSTLVTVLQEHARIGWDDDAHALLLHGLGERAKDAEFISPDLLVAPDGHTLGSRVGEWTFVHEAGRTRANAIKTPADHAALAYTGRDQRVHHLVLPKNSYSMSALAVSDDGSELVAMVGQALVRWPLADEPSTPVVREVPDLSTAVFASTGDALITAGGNISVAPRDVTVPLRPITQGDNFSHLAIAPDGSLGFVATHSALIAFDLATGTVRWSERGVGFDSHRIHAPGVGFFGLLLANDGRRLFVARDDGSVVLRDVTTGRDLGSLGAAVHQPITVGWVDTTHVLASDHQRVVVWDTTTGTIESAYTETRGFLSARVVGGDVVVARMTLCLGGGNSTTIAWPDRWTGRTPPAELLAGTMPDPMSACGNLQGLAWPPARGIASGAMRLGGAGQDFDLTTGSSLAATSRHIDAVQTSDGAVVKLAGFPKAFDTRLAGDFVFNPTKANGSDVVGVWRASNGTRLADLAVPYTAWDGQQRQEGLFVGVSDDGARVAVRGGVKVVGVFESATGKLLQSMQLDHEVVTAIGFGPDPAQFWVGTRSGAILHVAADGTVRPLGTGIGALVSRLTPAPDGTRLLAMGDDGGLRIVDASTGVVRATLVEFADDEPLAFTPTGAYGGTAEAASRVGWRFDAPVEIFRFEQFAQAFHRPELVSARLAGKRDDATAGLTRPPAVELGATPLTTAEAKTTLAIKFASSRRVEVVRAYREGREVASATPCTGTGSLALEVPLLAGGNTITVQAFDDLGYASNAAIAQITRTTGPQPDLYIVSVGVGAYPNLAQEFQLQLATADATGIASAFGADVGPGKQFGALHPTVLLDAQVTVPAVLAALDGLAKMKPDDLAIVFMAGHGIKPTPADDMVFVTSTAALTPASLRASGLGWSAVSERLARAKGRVIVLLDACHSGHVSQNLVVPNDQLAASLSRNGRAGVVVFAAAKGRQSSFEPTGARGLVLHEATVPLVHGAGDHGFFTGALLASLHDPASDRNGDGVLELSEWIHATAERVSLATEGQQTPWVARQEMFGDFAVVGLRKAK